VTRRNILEVIGHILFVGFYALLIAFSILFYGQAMLAALILFGWISLGGGIIILASSSRSRKKGRIPVEKSSSKGCLVESGMYAIVRHPEFVSHLLIITGLVCFTQRLVTLAIGLLMTFLLWFAMRKEEKTDIEKFGRAYVNYMQRVPRINLLAGIVRRRRRI
jgi:protein-S-isoprenylcysteine O-methyltransferase Ste14